MRAWICNNPGVLIGCTADIRWTVRVGDDARRGCSGAGAALHGQRGCSRVVGDSFVLCGRWGGRRGSCAVLLGTAPRRVPLAAKGGLPSASVAGLCKAVSAPLLRADPLGPQRARFWDLAGFWPLADAPLGAWREGAHQQLFYILLFLSHSDQFLYAASLMARLLSKGVHVQRAAKKKKNEHLLKDAVGCVTTLLLLCDLQARGGHMRATLDDALRAFNAVEGVAARTLPVLLFPPLSPTRGAVGPYSPVHIYGQT